MIARFAKPAKISSPAPLWRSYLGRHPDLDAELGRAETRKQRLLDAIAVANPKRKRDLARRFLRDPQVSLAYVWEGVRRKQQFDLSPDAIRRVANTMNVFHPAREQVRRATIQRWGRKSREVHRFGYQRFARQRMVAELGVTLHPLSSNQFFGRGVPAAWKAVEELVQSGNTHGAEIDVVSFYASVTALDELKALLRPLPGSVVEHVVWDGSLKRSLANSTRHLARATSSNLNRHTGLSQGSASSPIAGEVIMQSLLRCVPDWPMVIYHDNVFVFGRSHEEVVARINVLREAAARHAVGELRFGEERFWAYPEPLAFLGGEVDPTEIIWRWQPTQAALDRYLWACDQGQLTAAELRAILCGLPRFRRTYPLWLEGCQWVIKREAELAARVFMKSGEAADRERALDALLRAWTVDEFQTGPQDLIPAADHPYEGEGWMKLVRDLSERMDAQTASAWCNQL